jgi:protein-S-isoprenylcysteine O-methyltransferase Ste14
MLTQVWLLFWLACTDILLLVYPYLRYIKRYNSIVPAATQQPQQSAPECKEEHIESEVPTISTGSSAAIEQKQRTPLILPLTDSLTDTIWKFVWANVAQTHMVVLLYCVWPNFFLVRSFYESWISFFVGGAIQIISMALAAKAQSDMGPSWKIGTDVTTNDKMPLVTRGLYSDCRHPIASSAMYSALGLFLVLPNSMTFMMIQLKFLLLHIQLRLEDEHLERVYNQQWKHYKSVVPGRFWFPESTDQICALFYDSPLIQELHESQFVDRVGKMFENVRTKSVKLYEMVKKRVFDQTQKKVLNIQCS